MIQQFLYLNLERQKVSLWKEGDAMLFKVAVTWSKVFRPAGLRRQRRYDCVSVVLLGLVEESYLLKY